MVCASRRSPAAQPVAFSTQLARIGNSISPVSSLVCGGGPNCCTWAVTSASVAAGQRQGVVALLVAREHRAAGVDLLAARVAVAEHDVPRRLGATSSGTFTCSAVPGGTASRTGAFASSEQS